MVAILSYTWMRFARSFQANEIQRVFRGHLGRLYVREKRREKWEAKELSFFTYLCIQLQKCFRGYYSRKYKHDQARRKQYCRMLIEQGELVRQNLQKYAEELAEVRMGACFVSCQMCNTPGDRPQREESEMEKKKEEEFNKLAENLHHLVSTTRIPGVYKPVPYCNTVCGENS
jgi:hypothetical protein